jgi:thiamine-monophosphate kinase
MIDISDGLLADLAHIAVASNVLIDLDSAALADPLLTEAWATTKPAGPAATPDSPLHWALTGGEDHALVATFPARTPLPAHWYPIGKVHPPVSATSHSTRMVVDGRPWSGHSGWDHFR